MTEAEIKTEGCSDENQISSEKENTQSYSDGYFEENSSNLDQSDDENYEEDSLLSIDSSNKEDTESCQEEVQSEDKNSENSDNDIEQDKPVSKNSIKCGEIYWSESSKNYLYKCSMCPTRKFMGCIALKHHHSRYHKLFDETMKKQKIILPKNNEDKNLGKTEPKSGSSESEKQIALDQLQSLFKSKIITNQCFKCRKKFQSDQELMEHSKTHTNKKNLTCIYCKENFSRMEDLKCHQSTHSDKKPFTCKFCRKTFAHNGNKKQHERQHTEKLNTSKIQGKMKTTKQKVTVLK